LQGESFCGIIYIEALKPIGKRSRVKNPGSMTSHELGRPRT
jgi:hypothetical protein